MTNTSHVRADSFDRPVDAEHYAAIDARKEALRAAADDRLAAYEAEHGKLPAPRARRGGAR